ncbi:segregation and condensation protein A [Streptomyces sp. NBC_01233]|uniref:segregation and condensation protein A n=1 Tax=Streptomyces sp. NBC_01233 TaxID=2903787 RepID=UPI002E10DBB9|nr:segregation/condensation protein A [Streptomyces sp. NBC_01233]
MPFPAESGRPPRRLLGRGPGNPDAADGGVGPEAPDEPAARPAAAEGGPEPRPAPGPPEGPADPQQEQRGPKQADPAPDDTPAGNPATGAEAAAAPARGAAAPVAGGEAEPDVPAVRLAVVDGGAEPRETSGPSGGPTGPQQEQPGPRQADAAAGGGPAGVEGSPASAGGDPAVGADAAGSAGGAAAAPAAGGSARAGVPAGPAGGDGRFTLRLDNFEGPFDLLLQLISRHKLDVTEVALSKVTDEFMAHIRAMGPDWDLDQTTEFLVVAATLLDLKAARLLPAAEVEDEGDLALLEARDLLFARLLQYRAYKQIAEIFERRAEAEGRRYPRTVGLEPHHADLLPEVVISIGAEGFARLAVKAMQPKAKPQVYVDHIHAPLVSVREQAGLVVRVLKARGEATFQELTEDAHDTLTVVARFLALLELYREKAVVLDQEEALQTLTVRWSGGDGDGMPTVTDEFDQIVEAKD